MSAEIITFGCRLNAYESEAIRERTAGLDNTVVVNTCAVTAEAVRQSRQQIRKIRRERPEARIIVTGCAAQTDPDSYAKMPEVDFVLGNADKLDHLLFKPLAGIVRYLRKVRNQFCKVAGNPVVRVVRSGANLILDVGKAFIRFLAKLFFVHRCTRLDSKPQ